MAYMTTLQARTHLRLAEDQYTDTEVDDLVAKASRIVLRFLDQDAGVFEGSGGAPDDIIAATCLVMAELDQNREAGTSNPLSENVQAILRLSSYYSLPLA